MIAVTYARTFIKHSFDVHVTQVYLGEGEGNRALVSNPTINFEDILCGMTFANTK